MPVRPLPAVVEPAAFLTRAQRDRASRSLLLPGLGIDGQRRLAAARVLVIGAGGLGSPVLQYLAGAGLGVLGVVDFDTVDVSNLQRQVIHGTARIGEQKVVSAARSIEALNPEVSVVQHPVRLDRGNALELFEGYDLIVDGSDNFATRYLANDAAALLGKPYVWGSVLRFDGQVTVFWESAPDGRGLDYRDLHPVPPHPGEVLSCDEAGVLGSLCGTVGSMMATEAIKLITGIGEPLLGRVQTVDALTGRWREVEVRRAPSRIPVIELIDYEQFCGIGTASRFSVTTAELQRSDSSVSSWPVIDVREPFEHELVHIEGDRLVPLSHLLEQPDRAGPGPVVVYCKTGARSDRAVEALRAAGIEAVSLTGGIQAWLSSADVAVPRS